MEHFRSIILSFCLFLVLALTTPYAFARSATSSNNSISIALAFSAVSTAKDSSFHSVINEGAERAAHDYKNLKLKRYIQKLGEPEEAFLTDIVKDGADVIIALSFVKTEPLLTCAEKFRDVKFLMVDGVVAPLYPNSKSIIYRDHEGAFLMGMIAALKSKTGTVGFIGGRDIPIIRNFAFGYVQGAKYVNPSIIVLQDFIGKSLGAWDSPIEAKYLAGQQYDRGADVIFAAAGASGLGVLETANERHRYAIGVDTNQNGLYPGTIITSMLKKVDVAVYEALKEIARGNWKPGILNLGLKENALGYALDKNNEKLLDEAVLGIVENARKQIVDGQLEVKMYSPN